MTEEQIRKMADEYKDMYIERFRNIAEKAYIDGMLDAMKYMRDKLSRL